MPWPKAEEIQSWKDICEKLLGIKFNNGREITSYPITKRENLANPSNQYTLAHYDKEPCHEPVSAGTPVRACSYGQIFARIYHILMKEYADKPFNKTNLNAFLKHVGPDVQTWLNVQTGGRLPLLMCFDILEKRIRLPFAAEDRQGSDIAGSRSGIQRDTTPAAASAAVGRRSPQLSSPPPAPPHISAPAANNQVNNLVAGGSNGYKRKLKPNPKKFKPKTTAATGHAPVRTSSISNSPGLESTETASAAGKKIPARKPSPAPRQLTELSRDHESSSDGSVPTDFDLRFIARRYNPKSGKSTDLEFMTPFDHCPVRGNSTFSEIKAALTDAFLSHYRDTAIDLNTLVIQYCGSNNNSETVDESSTVAQFYKKNKNTWSGNFCLYFHKAPNVKTLFPDNHTADVSIEFKSVDDSPLPALDAECLNFFRTRSAKFRIHDSLPFQMFDIGVPSADDFEKYGQRTGHFFAIQSLYYLDTYNNLVPFLEDPGQPLNIYSFCRQMLNADKNFKWTGRFICCMSHQYTPKVNVTEEIPEKSGNVLPTNVNVVVQFKWFVSRDNISFRDESGKKIELKDVELSLSKDSTLGKLRDTIINGCVKKYQSYFGLSDKELTTETLFSYYSSLQPLELNKTLADFYSDTKGSSAGSDPSRWTLKFVLYIPLAEDKITDFSKGVKKITVNIISDNNRKRIPAVFFKDTASLEDIVVRYQPIYENLTLNVEFVYNDTIIAETDWSKTVGDFFKYRTGEIPEITLKFNKTDNNAESDDAANLHATTQLLQEQHIDTDRSDDEFLGDEEDEVEDPFVKGNGTYDKTYMYFKLLGSSGVAGKFVLEFDDDSWGGRKNRGGPKPIYDDSKSRKSDKEIQTYSQNIFGTIPQSATVKDAREIIANYLLTEKSEEYDQLTISVGPQVLRDFQIFTALLVPKTVRHFTVRAFDLNTSLIYSRIK